MGKRMHYSIWGAPHPARLRGGSELIDRALPYPAMAKVIIGGAVALETSFLAGEPREQTELFVPATSDALSWKENGVYLSYQRQKPRNLSAGGTGFAIHCRSR